MMWPWPEGEYGFSGRSSAAADPDTRIALTVVERLCEDARLRRQRVTVEVQDRVLILTGTVDSLDTLTAVTAVGRDVDGVRDVCTMVRVACAQDEATTDAFDDIVAGLSAEETSAAAPRGNRRVLLTVLLALAWGLLSLIMVTVDIGVALGVAVVVGGVLVLVAGWARRRNTVRPDGRPDGRQRA